MGRAFHGEFVEVELAIGAAEEVGGIPSLGTIASLKLQAQLKRDHAGRAITAQTDTE